MLQIQDTHLLFSRLYHLIWAADSLSDKHALLFLLSGAEGWEGEADSLGFVLHSPPAWMSPQEPSLSGRSDCRPMPPPPHHMCVTHERMPQHRSASSPEYRPCISPPLVINVLLMEGLFFIWHLRHNDLTQRRCRYKLYDHHHFALLKIKGLHASPGHFFFFAVEVCGGGLCVRVIGGSSGFKPHWHRAPCLLYY